MYNIYIYHIQHLNSELQDKLSLSNEMLPLMH